MGVGMNWELLSLSHDFETSRPRGFADAPAVNALRMLAGLEEIARASLTYRHAPAAAPVPAPAPQTWTQAPLGANIARTIIEDDAIPRSWATRRAAYRPALGDPSVIEALLKFKDRAPPIEAPVIARAEPTPRAPARREPDIQPARLERIEARDLEPCFPLAPSSNLLRPRQ